MVLGVVAAAVVLSSAGSPVTSARPEADDVDCSQVKCVALTFDDGPSPYTDRLLQILEDNDAKVDVLPDRQQGGGQPRRRQAHRRRGHGGGQPHLGTPQHDDHPARGHPGQFTKANDAIEAATGQRADAGPHGGRADQRRVLAEAKQQGLADINWDVIPFDWANDANTAATRYMLMTQIKPNSVVLFHDTYSSTVDLVYQFIPVLKANGYHLVTVSQMLGPRAPGSSYGSRDNGPPANDIADIPPAEIPSLPNTPSPAPMPNFPITDIPDQNSGGPNNGA